jgi:hypothetical protein
VEIDFGGLVADSDAIAFTDGGPVLERSVSYPATALAVTGFRL